MLSEDRKDRHNLLLSFFFFLIYFLLFPFLRLFSGLDSAFLFPAEPGDNCTPLEKSVKQKLWKWEELACFYIIPF